MLIVVRFRPLGLGVEAVRFLALDGLRGVAALLVLFYHAVGPTYGLDGFRGLFLAVDFFFMLSGFVVASAYEKRLAGGLTLAGFARIRAARLYPTIAAGVLLGALAWLVAGHGLAATLGATALALLLVPNLRDPVGLFPTNGPAWSLFYEVAANLLHAVALRHCRLPVLLALAVTAYALLLVLTWGKGSMTLGMTGGAFWGGFPRVLFGYTVGIILFRLLDRGRLPAPDLPPWILAAALPALLLLYRPDSWASGPLLILAFPLLLGGGVGSSLAGWQRGVARQLGRLSYPLYAVHVPVVDLVLRLPLGRAGGLVAAMAGALAVAALLARILEAPLPRPRRPALRKTSPSTMN